jgi:hypothetical protein
VVARFRDRPGRRLIDDVKAVEGYKMIRRAAVAIGLALLVLAAGALPTFALGYSGDPFTGLVGQFGGPGEPEVICRYNSAGRLNSVTVRPLKLWGNHDEPTLVGQRYIIRQAGDGAGRLVFKSRLRTDLATKTVAADSFKKHTYYVHENLAGSQAYYVPMAVKWFDASGTVEGTGNPLLYTEYLLKKGTESRYSNACLFDYSVEYWAGD